MVTSYSNTIFPPRPKGKMAPSDLSFYEKTSQWFAQRKFNGSRALVYISHSREVSLFSRHGRPFLNFDLTEELKFELISNLYLQEDKDYWLDGELMNKGKDSKKEIIFFDVLHIGKYLFYKPTQEERMLLLDEICQFPKELCEDNLSLKISKNFYLAERFFSDFEKIFQESFSNPKIEGLILRKKKVGLENVGNKEYETNTLIRCRKPFSKTKGYEF